MLPLTHLQRWSGDLECGVGDPSGNALWPPVNTTGLACSYAMRSRALLCHGLFLRVSGWLAGDMLRPG